MNVTTYKNALWLTAAAALAASAVPASAEVYLTESQALAVILGNKAVVRREQKVLEAALRRKLEQESNLRFPETTYTFFIATQDGRPSKYALVLNEIGKTEPITFMVGMTLEGKVTEVAIMEFRENRGWEVKEKRFLNQFRGKTVRNAIRVDEDIINYTGATLSSKAVARGVKRALLLLDAFYPGEARTKLGAARDFAAPRALRPIAVAHSAERNLGLYRQVRYAMGTQCEIRAWCASSDESNRFFNEGFRELERIEQVFSAYREDSELSDVNRHAGHVAVGVSEEFFLVTREAMRYSRGIGGAADITIGPLLRAWGIRQSEPRTPSKSEIAAAKRLVGNEKLILDEAAKSIRFRHAAMELDFGGIAKGYAAEKIAKRLQKLGAPSVLVNLGRSSLYASPVRKDFVEVDSSNEIHERIDRWPVAISHPDGQSAPPLFFFLQPGMALSTSGTSEQKFDTCGNKFSHVINPSLGMPIEGTSSATTIAQNGILSEVASKELLLNPTPKKEWSLKGALDGWAHFAVSPGGELIENISNES